MGRCSGMALYLMAIVLLTALFFAPSAKCRPEPLDVDDGKASISSSGHAIAMALNSTAALPPVNGGSGGSGAVKLVWCIARKCVYEGRGNAPCFCCGAIKPNSCYETRDQCNDNCV